MVKDKGIEIWGMGLGIWDFELYTMVLYFHIFKSFFKKQSSFAAILLLFPLPYLLGQQSEQPSFSVRSSVDTNYLVIGQQTCFTLRAEFPAGNKISWPDIKDTMASRIEIVEKTKIDTAYTTDKTKEILSQRFKITSFDTGYFVIPPVKFIMNRDSGNFAETEPLLLCVQGVSVDTTQAIKDIKGPLNVPFSIYEILPYIGIGLAIAAIIFLLYYYLKKRKKKIIVPVRHEKPKEPAHVIALRKLKELEEKKLWQKNELKLYYSEITDIIRAYIEHRFDIIAMEMTTDEILDNIRKFPIETGTQGQLRTMLELADLVKFAKASPLPNEHQLCMEIAYAFVKSTIPTVSKIIKAPFTSPEGEEKEDLAPSAKFSTKDDGGIDKNAVINTASNN